MGVAGLLIRTQNVVRHFVCLHQPTGSHPKDGASSETPARATSRFTSHPDGSQAVDFLHPTNKKGPAKAEPFSFLGVAGLEPAVAEAGGFTVGTNPMLVKPIQRLSI